MEQQLQIGVISSTHGLKGEVKVYPTTDDKERFKKLEKVWLDTGKEQLQLHIQQVKFAKQLVIVKFKEFQDINEVEQYKGKSLLVEREDAISLEENEYFIADLIGMQVMEEDGSLLGELSEVLETGANEVYVVTTADKKELLIPAIRECIVHVDLEHNRMTVHLLDGLSE